MQDCLGNTVTLSEPAHLDRVNDFVHGFLACEAKVVQVLQAEADASPYVQACCAALHLFAESPAGPRGAQPYLQRARASTLRVTAREQGFIAAVAAWAAGDLPQAIALLQAQARQFPRDLPAIKLGQYLVFNRGDTAAMLRLALAAQPAASDVPYLHGMLAFGYEQCHLLHEAEAAARHGIALCRKEPWAQHALAHVMLTQGRLHEGLDFMRAHSDCWTGLNSFMVTHNWWHLAVFALELGDGDEALRLYDSQVWGVEPGYSQDQINAVSLLARLELAGVDVGPRWQVLAPYLAARTHDQVLPFLDMQYLYGLARAARPEAHQLLRQVRAHAASLGDADPTQRDAWQRVAVPACEGLLAHATGDWQAAVHGLGAAWPRLLEIGGSHAQRALFEQLYLDALARCGHLTAVQNVLMPALNASPESVRLRRQLAALHAQLGLPLPAPAPALR